MKRIHVYCLGLLCLLSGTVSAQVPPAQVPHRRHKPKPTYYLDSKETWRYAVFPYDRDRDKLIFARSSKPTTILPSDYRKIEALVAGRVDVYNKSGFSTITEPEKYYKQLIAVVNTKGEKEVWVHCCCQVMKDDWKTQLINVKDGGICYFDVKLNLTYGTVLSFATNGPG